MAAGASAPAIPGYKVVEQRRTQGAHGGLATYYRQSLKLETTQGNEYGLSTKLILPTSQRINIINVYIPPTSSLARRDITEAQATAQVELVLEKIQPQHTTLICGDFNARIGTRTPLLNNDHPPRIANDTHICPRANWFV
jgi:exonuclease III